MNTRSSTTWNMTERNHLVEQHILEYESRLKHVDEVIAQAHGHDISDTENLETSQLLESLKQDRETLKADLSELKKHSDTQEIDKLASQMTPLDIWNTVAMKLEKLAEKIDKK